jgi:hypothetical protein
MKRKTSKGINDTQTKDYIKEHDNKWSEDMMDDELKALKKVCPRCSSISV